MSESFHFLEFSLVVIERCCCWPTLPFSPPFSRGVAAYVPLAAFFLLSYAGLQFIRWRPRHAFVPVLIATIAAFIWLKKYAFVPPSLFLQFAYVTVGLSYILFRVLHLMIDARSGAVPGRISVLSFFNYTTSFTTL